jgi:glycosyltransferase involved in cell wall biosynthesis
LRERNPLKSVCLIVQNSYPSDVRIRKYAQTLVRRGHKAVVIASRSAKQPRHEFIDGAEVFRIPPAKRRAGKLSYACDYLIFFFLAFLQLNWLDLMRRFDVVHVNTLPDFLVFCTVIQKITGRTIVLDMHEIMPEFFMSKYSVPPDSMLIRLLLFIERISLRFADQVITVNHAIMSAFKKRISAEMAIEVIMNTADSSVIKSFPKIPHENFNCVYHGTITDIYGLDLAIEAFWRACARLGSHKMMFHIFGGGPQIPFLKELIRKLHLEKQVILYGETPHREMWKNLAIMDLGLLACRKDIFMDLSFSNKLAEYVYLKIPVLHSDLASVRHYFDENEILYFHAGDAKELSEKICYAYSNPILMQKRAAAAFEKYSQIDWGVMSQRYLSLIEGAEVKEYLGVERTGVDV